MPACDVCEYYANKRGEFTQCEDCPKLKCRPENQDAIDVFSYCINQIRYAPDGKVLGLDYNAVEIVMKRLGIHNKNKCFKLVLKLQDIFILKVGE